jgi:DNA phosphorothioation-associated putative methyltransferase
MADQPRSKPTIRRQKTAIRRTELSRPVRNAVDDGLLTPDRSFFDYGCGHGDDLRLLRRRGFEEVDGWDPAHNVSRPDASADVVNIGYVVNVIEDPQERRDALLSAWSLARDVLIVSARLTFERSTGIGQAFNDGVIYETGTFQKYFEQDELRRWIATELGQQPIAAAPGVFYAFRDPGRKAAFLATRSQRRLHLRRTKVSEAVFEKYREHFEEMLTFLSQRGRLPADDEHAAAQELRRLVGGPKRIRQVLGRVVGESQWQEVEIERSRDLLVYVALAAFSGRPPFSQLPRSIQLDTKAFFGTYKRATELADHLLFAAGSLALVNRACEESAVGKLTPTALYVHLSAVHSLDPVLRVYEGCGRVLLGRVDDANVIKLHRSKPKVSYLEYPGFERVAHPALKRTIYVDLRSLTVDTISYEGRANPFILHRKELFLADSHPLKQKFAALSSKEEKVGLLAEPTIGTREGWESVLQQSGYRLAGHQLVTSPTPKP